MTERKTANTTVAPVGLGTETAAGTTVPDGRLGGADLDRMAASAARAANFLKSLGHEQRLMILCHLVPGEKSVGELEAVLGARQSAVSQQLARLRHEGLLATRRDGTTVYYRLADERSERMIGLLYEMFCKMN